MSDSDSDRPPEAAITKKLRDIVIGIHKTGKPEELTLKRVRARAEQELGLEEGFFKKNANWKQKSEDTITEAVDKYCDEEPSPKKSPKKAATKPKPKPKPTEKKTKATAESARGVKRKNVAPAKKSTKRRKASSDEESEAELSELAVELSDAGSQYAKKLMQRGKKVVAEDSDEEDEVTKPARKARAPVESDDGEAEPATPAKKPAPKDDVSESELSELIDESPKKSKQKKAPAAKKEKAAAKPKAAPKAKASDDPDDAEIKRLQGWLVKCGIRKVWSRDPELAKCDSVKEKIRLLKNMLKDAGMDGKYSNEKAASIKEKREFEKDLAAIQEGEMHWGKTSAVTSTGRPSRRAAAARPPPQQKIVLSDDSDEDMDGGGKAEDSDDDEDDDDVKADSDEASEGDSSGGNDSGSK